jgi:ribulose-5-phosphate 4-epimerase/fuculose-1-phosphate aldolase
MLIFAMLKNQNKFADDLLAAAHLCARYSLVYAGSGNLSCKAGADAMMITAAGSWMSTLTEKEIVTCAIGSGRILRGKTKPSSESNLHRMIYQANSDAGAALHFQSRRATAISCNKKNASLNFNVIPEFPFYIGDVGFVPALEPGTRKLAEAVSKQSKARKIIIMQNHGIVAVGINLKRVVEMALFFELACGIILANGSNLSTLPLSIAWRLKARASSI